MIEIDDLLEFIEKRRAFITVYDSPTYQGYLMALNHLEEYIKMIQRIRKKENDD